MRQVNEAELVWNVKLALGRVSKERVKAMASRESAVHRRAVQMVAEDIVKALGNYEVLSQASVPEYEDLFSRAAYRDN